jgi:mono/diheme cytochrome c family protein
MHSKISCSRTRRFSLLICCVLAATLGACSHSNSGSARPLTATEAQGKQAYSLACMRCHEPFDLQTIDDGPSLYGLFKKPTLPSGAPATDEQVRDVILHGRGKMRPADPIKLKPEDVEPLIQYLHTR